MDNPTILFDLPCVQIDLMSPPDAQGRITYYHPNLIQDYREEVLAVATGKAPSPHVQEQFLARLVPFRQPARLIIRQSAPPILELYEPRTTRPDYRLGTMAARNFEPEPVWKSLMGPPWNRLVPETDEELFYLVIRRNDDFIDYEPE